MPYPPHVFDEDYTGPRWVYGMRNRPPMLGAIPRGFIIGSHRTGIELVSAGHRHGTIAYPVMLSDHDVDAYELTFIEQIPAQGALTL